MVDYNKFTLFHGMTERMRYLSERQNVIAQNIANANTPGYVAKDLKPVDFANVLANHSSKLEMAVTNSAHMRPTLESDFKTIKKKKSFETTINGNNVVLEEQMQKMAETSGSFQETTALYRKMSDIVRLATGANR